MTLNLIQTYRKKPIKASFLRLCSILWLLVKKKAGKIPGFFIM